MISGVCNVAVTSHVCSSHCTLTTCGALFALLRIPVSRPLLTLVALTRIYLGQLLVVRPQISSLRDIVLSDTLLGKALSRQLGAFRVKSETSRLVNKLVRILIDSLIAQNLHDWVACRQLAHHFSKQEVSKGFSKFTYSFLVSAL